MSNRRRLAREKLEIYLVHLLMAYRRLIFIVGLFLFAYSIAIFFINHVVGFASLVPALYLLVLSNSYLVTLYTARLGAWIGTLWRHEE
jgi:Na+/melibiose symporter-like transporter